MKVTDEEIAVYFENLHEVFDQMNGRLINSENHCPACVFAHVAKIYELDEEVVEFDCPVGTIRGEACYNYSTGLVAYLKDRDMSTIECISLFNSHGLRSIPYGANQWNIPAAQVFRAIADAKYPRD